MFGSAALSNHGVSSEWELREMGDDGYYGEEGGSVGSFTRNPLYYHRDVTDVLTITADRGKFYTVSVVTSLDNKGFTLDIPKKIVVKENGRVYVHEATLAAILAKERETFRLAGTLTGRAHKPRPAVEEAPRGETDEVEVTRIESGVWYITYRGQKYTTRKESLVEVNGGWELVGGSRLTLDRK